MLEFITTGGRPVDVLPNQEVAITIENAFFSTDRIPVLWTTDVDLAASRPNCDLYGYPNGTLISPQRREINVEMRINSIPVMLGTLKLLGPAENCLKASFAGVAIEDSLSGSLHEAAFAKWNFGKLRDIIDDKTLYNEVMYGAGAGTRPDFATPLMVRNSMKGEEDIFCDMATTKVKEHYATKFLNSPVGNFLIPVVRLKYILQTVFPDCEIDEEFAAYINKIGIVAPYRKNGSLADYATGCLDKDDDGNYILDLADAMPNISIEEFVKNILMAFGATIFITNEGKRMIGNKTIIQSTDFDDWTYKIQDDVEQEFEDGQAYEYGFSSGKDVEIKGTVIECATIADCLKAGEGAVVHCAETQDYYTVVVKSIKVGMTNGESWTSKQTYLSYLKQGGMTAEESATGKNDAVSAQCSFIPVESWPYLFFSPFSWAGTVSTSVMTPVVETPAVGGTRPSDIYFGTLEALDDVSVPSQFANAIQLTSNGCYGYGWLMSIFLAGPTPLNLQGANGLSAKFHHAYKEWLATPKDMTRVQVNFTASDIANLRIWRKVMIQNLLFFIRSLTITLNTSKDDIKTEAELIAA